MSFHPYSGGLNSKYDLKYCSFSGYKTGINEPQHDKTNKITCAPSEDSEQPGNPPSLIRVFVVGLENIGSLVIHWAPSKGFGQTGWMPRLIWVFAGRTVNLLVLSRAVTQFNIKENILIFISFRHSNFKRCIMWLLLINLYLINFKVLAYVVLLRRGSRCLCNA